MKLFRFFSALIVGSFVFLSPSLYGQSGSLYGASVDESAILVRVINGRTTGPVQLRVGAHRLSAQNPGDVSGYVPIPADVFILRYENQTIEFLPEPQTLYTLLAYDRGIRILRDTPHRDPARAQIYLYVSPSLSSAGVQSLELRTSDGNQGIIAPTEPGSSTSIAVNPLTISVATFQVSSSSNSQGSRLHWAPPIELSMARGQSYTLVAFVTPTGQPGLQVLQARVLVP